MTIGLETRIQKIYFLDSENEVQIHDVVTSKARFTNTDGKEYLESQGIENFTILKVISEKVEINFTKEEIEQKIQETYQE